MKFPVSGLTAVLSCALLAAPLWAQQQLSPFAPVQVSTVQVNAQKRGKDDFPLATSRAVAPIYLDANDFPVVRLAADALAEDIQSVTGARPAVGSAAPVAGQGAVFIGTLGKSRLIDGLVARKKLDVSSIRGGWERFVLATVKNPLPGIAQGLVIAGSDRRGTAFGAFSLSESIGVSPWVWWADVAPTHRDLLTVSRANYSSKSPSVKYRGIFINDEDFGLQPWAAQTFEPETKDIGPKTYAKVCELLLRLKANYLWPAMHPSTKAFNLYAQNKVVADRYAIVMGSSHAEPMLRNNVSEWNHNTDGDFNYVTNRDKVLSYWEGSVQNNGEYENTYTLGMRGIHDSPMEGGGTTEEKVARLADIFAQQRAILARHVNPDPARVPQIFVPYKEVLSLYQNGLKVPDDVTLVWVDDNHGYIRQLSTPAEQKRAGGSGVYYHFSYWGVPQDYLWLGSTSPALTAYEMKKAYAYGADRLWVFNVGDIKPIEKEMEFGLRLAYDVNRYPMGKAMDYLGDFAKENFGAVHAQEIAAVLKEYYRLAAQVKPEHIDRVTFTPAERAQRLAAYDAISRRADALYAHIPAAQKDAFFQLVLYPVQCAALMNRKQSFTVLGEAALALQAYDGIQRFTLHYNQEMSGGKWNHMMNDSPRDTAVFQKPDAAKIVPPAPNATPLFQLEPQAAQVSGAMKVADDTLVATPLEPQAENSGNAAKFAITSPQNQKVSLYFLARCPDDKSDSWFVALGNQKVVSNDQATGAAFKWLKIMDADLRAGPNELVIEQREAGTMIQKIALMPLNTAPFQAEPTPDFSCDAASYSAAKNTRISQWKKIEGLGITNAAMTLSPYQTASIPDAGAAKAPSLTYSFSGSFPACRIETRWVPTHQINGVAGLRYAVWVDGGAPQIRDINGLEFSGVWGSNVLNGYAAQSTAHRLNAGTKHTVTIAPLDPSMVLSQVRVFADESAAP